MKSKSWKNKLIKMIYMVYESTKCTYDFRKFRTIRCFGDSIFSSKITISEADKKQSNLLNITLNLNNKVRPRSKAKEEKINSFKSSNALYEGQKITVSAFKTRIFPFISTQGKGRKILSPKYMLQRLPVALAEVQTGSTSENIIK